MKNTIKNLAMAAILVVTMTMSLQAQVQPDLTTLSSAITTTRTVAISVGSVTNWAAGDVIIIDHEAMLLPSPLPTGTIVTPAARGYDGTLATTHVSGATVMRISMANLSLSDKFGSCTRLSQNILPLPSINRTYRDVLMYDCNNGQWIKVTLPDDVPTAPLVSACNIAIGSVAYASVGTNSADVANKRMTTSFFMPYTKVVTGIQFLQGGTATTDNVTVQIADGGGKIIATGAAAGTLLATANTFKQVAFALTRTGAAQTKTIIPGPAFYFVSLVGNGSTAGSYQTVPASTFPSVLSQGTTSITFGGFPDFTPPTTFTADLAPVACLYN